MKDSLAVKIAPQLSLLVGIRYPRPEHFFRWHRLIRRVWVLYADSVTLVLLLQVTSLFLRMYISNGDNGTYCGCAAAMGYILHYLLKLAIFGRHQRMSEKLFNEVQSMSEELSSNGIDDGYEEFYDRLYKRAVTTALIKGGFELASTISLTSIFVVMSFISGVPVDHRTPGMSWTPYDNSQNPVYTMTCVLELVAFAGTAARNAALDLFFWMMLIVPTIQLRYLNHLLKVVVERNVSDFRIWLEYHQRILRTIQEFRTISSPYLAVNYVTTLTVLMLSGIAAISTTSWTISQQIICNALCVSNAFQLYLVSITGDWISEGNDNAAFEGFSDRILSSDRFIRKDFLFVVARTRHSLQIRFGGINPLSSATFCRLIRLTMTYFVTIVQLRTDKEQ